MALINRRNMIFSLHCLWFWWRPISKYTAHWRHTKPKMKFGISLNLVVRTYNFTWKNIQTKSNIPFWLTFQVSNRVRCFSCSPTYLSFYTHCGVLTQYGRRFIPNTHNIQYTHPINNLYAIGYWCGNLHAHFWQRLHAILLRHLNGIFNIHPIRKTSTSIIIWLL